MLSKISTGKTFIVYYFYFSPFEFCLTISTADFPGILEIRTVSEGGILAIKGVKSQYYISMNKAGQLQGKVICYFLVEKTHFCRQ